MFRRVWDTEFDKLNKLAEHWRREPQNKDCDTGPIKSTMADIEQFCAEVGGPASDEKKRELLELLPVDYAEAIMAITLAMSHLTEAIPCRQPNRIRAAYAMLAMGKRALGNFLETKNVL